MPTAVPCLIIHLFGFYPLCLSHPLTPTSVFWDHFPHKLLALGSSCLDLVLGERTKDLWEMFPRQYPGIVLWAKKTSYDNAPPQPRSLEMVLKEGNPGPARLRRPHRHLLDKMKSNSSSSYHSVLRCAEPSTVQGTLHAHQI